MAELIAIAERVADQASNGEQIEAFVTKGTSTRVQAYQGEVEQLTVATSQGIGIRVIADGRQGFAYAGSLDDAVISETLAEARDNVAFGEPDELYGLARPDGVEPIPQDRWSEDVLATPTEAKIDLAMEIERRVVDADPRIAGVRVAAYGDSAGQVAVASSQGIRIEDRSTGCHVSVSALATDGDETTIGGGVDAARRPVELDIDSAATDAVERATRLLGAGKPKSRALPIVLEPRLAATVLGVVGGMLTGERVLKGRSPFADRVGQEIASPLLTLVDDATDSRSLGADMYDAEGLACRPNVLIDQGVLQGFLHNYYTGRRAGAASTGSAVRGYASTPGVGLQVLTIRPGSGTLDELMADVDDGLLVQSLSGLHSGVNPVSGDFSVGAEGLMIRNGTAAEPVREATIASTVQRMLTNIRAVGGDLEWLPGGAGVASLVVEDVALSGT